MLGGVALLLVAIAGLVAWVTGFTFLKEGLLDGVPFFFDRGGRQIQISGRVVGVVAMVVPLLGAAGGFWLLRSAFGRDNEQSN
jgi:hypothetical protein